LYILSRRDALLFIRRLQVNGDSRGNELTINYRPATFSRAT
jgi:hypothetical protein